MHLLQTLGRAPVSMSVCVSSSVHIPRVLGILPAFRTYPHSAASPHGSPAPDNVFGNILKYLKTVAASRR